MIAMNPGVKCMLCFNTDSNTEAIPVRIVDVETCEGISLPVGDLYCHPKEGRELMFSNSEGEILTSVRLKNVFIMNSDPGWTLSLSPRKLGLPSAVLIGMVIWTLPLPIDAIAKGLLWILLSIPILIKRERQQLAIELADDEGVLILQTPNNRATAQILNI